MKKSRRTGTARCSANRTFGPRWWFRLISRNELIGALSLTRHGENAAEFTAANLELMEAFASRAAVAIDNAQLLKDLGRKNKLLQLLIEEAHHRIKNNLQMVSGLLQLEAESAPVESSKGFLQTAITRIQAIAQVHNLLSEEMPEKVDVNALITTIVHMLVSSAPGTHGTPDVTVDVEHVWLGAEQAVPLALIVNELVSNTFVHGRSPQGQPLRARIQCRQTGRPYRAGGDRQRGRVCRRQGLARMRGAGDEHRGAIGASQSSRPIADRFSRWRCSRGIAV